ncbi:hypothetical protein Sjap_006271 [Stephania japonica]|uniref:Uncharacterized protein n=1 Tax=Stephania japonica TaxID=461633 RepID=A0AAP0K5I5_9MAGN
MYELNHEYTKLTEQLEATKKRGEELRQLVSVHAKDLDIENLDLKQLEQLKGRLQGLQIQMGQRFDELFSTLPPVLDHQLMINGDDMICDDPRHFAPQANDLDNVPNASHSPPQYVNFNDLDNAPNAGLPLYYNFNDDNAPNASHLPPQYDNFNDLDNAPNASHPPLQYDNFNDLDNAPNAGPPLYYNFNDLDNAPNASHPPHPPPQYDNFNDLDNAPNGSHPPLQYDNFNDLDNAPNAGPPLYYNFNDDNAPNAAPLRLELAPLGIRAKNSRALYHLSSSSSPWGRKTLEKGIQGWCGATPGGATLPVRCQLACLASGLGRYIKGAFYVTPGDKGERLSSLVPLELAARESFALIPKGASSSPWGRKTLEKRGGATLPVRCQLACLARRAGPLQCASIK